MALFDVLFGWRKASKCKKLIRRVQFRLRLLRNKRDSIIRHSRSDVSRLVQMGYLDIATQRAEQLLKDKSVMELYDLLNHFCEFIITNLSYIRRHRECPNDVNEAVSSLIFTSARCGELPELRRIRELFRERYGESFALTAVNLLPGNLVNSKIRNHLSLKSISDDSKFKLVDEFASDQLRVRGQPEILAIEYASELHKQIEEMAERQTLCLDIVPISSETIVDLKEEDVVVTKVEKKAISTDLVATENGLQVAKSQSRSSRVINSTSHKGDSFDLVAAPFKLRTAVSCSEEKESGVGLENASEEREGTVSSSSVENSPHFAELKVVYLDDVEELQSRPKRDEEGLDQRFVKFKPSVVPKSTKPGEIAAYGYAKQYEPSEEDLPPRVSRKNKVVPGKRLRWRPVSREPESIQDSEYVAYYNAQNGNSRKHLKQSQMKAQDRLLNSKQEYNNPQPGKVIAAQRELHCNCCAHSKSGDHKVFYANPNHARGFRGKPDVLPNHSLDTADASTSSDSEEDGGMLLSSYSRAMTMPPKRQTVQLEVVQLEVDGGRMPRSNSCPYQPNHVHPKLPDYEELAARFSALKEEFLGTSPKPRIIGKHLQK